MSGAVMAVLRPSFLFSLATMLEEPAGFEMCGGCGRVIRRVAFYREVQA